MSSLLAWLGAAPQVATAVATAAITALVAVLVAVLTQWILGRRARTELLTKKLEELYLSLNEVAAHNVKRAEEILPFAKHGYPAQIKIPKSSVERQALDLHKKIVMLVRLYFPKVSSAHQNVFRKNGEVHQLVHSIESGLPASEERLISLSGAYGDALAAMEREIIENRRFLVRDGILPKRYRRRDA